MKFSVLQWNVWYMEDIRNIATFLKEHPADIICLQELTINFPGREIKDGPAYIAEQLGYHYYHKGLTIESTDGETIMLANGIFSRFPITGSRFAWINEPKSGGGYSDEYRAYIEVALDVDGQMVHIGTTHMSYTHRFQETPEKKEETQRLMDELKRHDNNVVFTGDLNAIPGSYTISAISELLANAGPDVSQKSWTTKPFSYNGFEESDLNWRLDYVFASSDLKIESSKILPTDYSDHLPILTELSR
jgi:endonuclease/exonuclease/phosphatase family metal-dependent hydrolase